MTFLLGSLLYLSSGLSLATISPKKLMYLHNKKTYFQIVFLLFTFLPHHFTTLLVIMLSSIQAWQNLPISSHLTVHCKNTIPKIWKQYFQKRNCVATVPISTFTGLWDIFIFSGPVCLFRCRKIFGPILSGNIQIAHRHMNVDIGLRPRNSFSRNT
jgi:hypothetical protein